MNPPVGHSFRPVRDADGPALQQLVFGILREFGLEPDPDGPDTDLAAPASYVRATDGWFAVLLDARDTIIGSVALEPRRPGVVELRKMYLHAAHRGRGLGRFLLESALNEARRRGCVRVTLETARVLREAIRLYEGAGFRRTPFAPQVCRCDLAMELELRS